MFGIKSYYVLLYTIKLRLLIYFVVLKKSYFVGLIKKIIFWWNVLSLLIKLKLII